jgi:hypothetical protein
MKRRLVGAVVAASLLGTAGCGSSKPLTSGALATRASAICRQRTAEAAEARKRLHAASFRAALVAGLPAQEKTVKELAQLQPPASARQDYKRFLTIQEMYLAGLKRYISTGRGTTDFHEVGEISRITEELGIAACQ